VPLVLLELDGRALAVYAIRYASQAGDVLGRLEADALSSRSSCPLIDVPCTPEPTCTRKIIPCSAIRRASSEACGCVKPAGSAVDPAIIRAVVDTA
jgi:hypothetical protein